MEYGPRSWSVYYELNCVCFWCQCLGNKSKGLAGTALGKEDAFRETSRALCLGRRRLRMQPLYKHTSAFWSLSFPLILHGLFLLRALLSISKKGFISFSKDKSKTYFRFSLPIAFSLLPWSITSTTVSRKWNNFTSLPSHCLCCVMWKCLHSLPLVFFSSSFLFSSVKIQRDIWMEMPGTNIFCLASPNTDASVRTLTWSSFKYTWY